MLLKSAMHSWRNWQTRKTKDLVGDHAGSTPVECTKNIAQTFVCAMFFSVPKMQELRGGKSAKSIVDKTADTRCLSCAVFIRQLLLSASKVLNLFQDRIK